MPPLTPVLFTIENLNLAIGTQIIFDNAELTIHEGERIGLIGRNGCGKSTFLNFLIQPTISFERGKITKRQGLRIGMMRQDFTLDEEKTIYENILNGAKFYVDLHKEYENPSCPSARHEEIEQILNNHQAWRLEYKLDIIMEALHVPHKDKIVKTLSGGEKRRVALATELAGAPDVLLLDEPTNHLDTETIEWIENYISTYQGSCIIVTHDRYFLDKVSTRIVELSHGKFYSYEGDYSHYLIKKAELQWQIEKQEESRQKFLRSEIEWVRSNPQARTTRNQGRLQRYYDVANLNAPPKDESIDLIVPQGVITQKKIIEFKDVSFAYPHSKNILSNFNFKFEPNTKLGIIGKNGSGKTTFLKMIMKELQVTSGDLFIAEQIQFNYIDQNRTDLDETKTVVEEIGEGNDFVIFNNQKITIWSYLKRFLFTDERINTQINRLSGGEKARLLLAKQLKKGGNFLILDEPTNDLDLATLRLLEEALANYSGCLAIVSHDRYFLNRTCTSILSFEEGQTNPQYELGNYDDFYAKKQHQKNTIEKEKIVPEKVENKPNKQKSSARKFTNKEQREYDSIEENILTLEENISALEQEFSSSDFFKVPAEEQSKKISQLTENKKQLEILYQRWEELEIIKQGFE